MKENHFMIDIETLGTNPNSHIMSIACLKFNPMGNPEAKHHEDDVIPIVWERWDIIPRTCQEIGLEIDANTVLWWFQQSEAARMDAVHGLYKEKVHINVALLGLNSFIKKYANGIGDTYIWAKSPQFDLTILENAYRKCSMTKPWKYQDQFDVRTVFKLWGNRKRPDYTNIVKEMTKGTGINKGKMMSTHNPVYDCYLQSYLLAHIWKELYR
jgi:hypothetical protein